MAIIVPKGTLSTKRIVEEDLAGSETNNVSDFVICLWFINVSDLLLI